VISPHTPTALALLELELLESRARVDQVGEAARRLQIVGEADRCAHLLRDGPTELGQACLIDRRELVEQREPVGHAGVRENDSNARRAAATARSTSAALPSAIVAIAASVAGSMTSSVRSPSGFTHAPSM
jgi:hypothetical protein